jgi:hypothetical protein
MNPRLAAVLSLIPERVARTHVGATFTMSEAAAACAHPDRLAFVAGRLHWMSPLERITKDEQRALGLLVSNARPAAELVDADELAADEGLDEPLDAEDALSPEFLESERQGSVGTLVAP